MQRPLNRVSSVCSALAVMFAVLGLLAGPTGTARADDPIPPPPPPAGCGSWNTNGCVALDEPSCILAGTGVGGCLAIAPVGGGSCKCKWGIPSNTGPNPQETCGCFLKP